MNPQVSLFIVAVFICLALLVDSRKTVNTSVAVWIPTIWAAMVASRPLDTWFESVSGDVLLANVDGSVLARNMLILLMLSSAAVLTRRELPWARWRREYAWILVFFAFCGISLIWSDYPAVGLRRWVRAIGAVMMILVVASEKDPVAATAAVGRRCAIVLLPLSVIVIKYFREFGVSYDAWTGAEMLVGVTSDKNALGRLALICGLCLFWELVTGKSNQHIAGDRLSQWGRGLLLSIAIWLLFASDSKTSLMCFLMGTVVMVLAAHPFVRNRVTYLGTVVFLATGTGLLLNNAFDISGIVLEKLGRDPTLTDRTFIWNDLLNLRTNPLIGVGYDTFWLGSRLEWFVRVHAVNSAHNGYLETYLELGSVGIFLLGCVLVAVFGKLKTALAGDVAYGRLLAGVFVVFLLYNWTESSYKPTTFVCFTLLLVAMTSPRPQEELVAAAAPLTGGPGPKPRSVAGKARGIRPYTGTGTRPHRHERNG